MTNKTKNMKEVAANSPASKTQNKSVGIGYGILCAPISKQLKKQGLNYDKEKADDFEEMRQSINNLSFGCLLTGSQATKLIKKLHNKVVAHVAKMNGLSLGKSNLKK